MRSSAARAIQASASNASHIGSSPIHIPASVKVTLPIQSNSPSLLSSSLEATRILSVSGPLGSQTLRIPPPVILESSADSISLRVHDQDAKTQRALWGLTRSLLNNAIVGVSVGYSTELRLVGVGYRAAVEPIPKDLYELKKQLSELSRKTKSSPPPSTDRLNMKLGYSHPVYVDIPAGITVSTPAPTRILLRGTDKQKLGLFAAEIRRWRKPEPYRGKGIFIGDETIKLKEIKKK